MLVLGSMPDNRKGKGAHPTKPNTQTGTRRDRAGEPATREQEGPRTGSQGRTRGQKHDSTLRVLVLGSVQFSCCSVLGSAPCEHRRCVSFCSVLGSAPEGSATEPSTF